MGQKGSMKWGALHSKEGRAEQGPSGEGRGGHSALTAPHPHSRCLTLT